MEVEYVITEIDITESDITRKWKLIYQKLI